MNESLNQSTNHSLNQSSNQSTSVFQVLIPPPVDEMKEARYKIRVILYSGYIPLGFVLAYIFWKDLVEVYKK
jgi:hypothetical protein